MVDTLKETNGDEATTPRRKKNMGVASAAPSPAKAIPAPETKTIWMVPKMNTTLDQPAFEQVEQEDG